MRLSRKHERYLVFDVTRHGVTLKFLIIVDEGSHDGIDIAVGRQMTARDVVCAPDEAVRRHGKPRHPRNYQRPRETDPLEQFK